MELFRKKKEKTELDLLEERFRNVKVWNKDKIEKNYDKRSPGLVVALAEIISKFPDIDFLVLFEEKGEIGKRSSWYSEIQGKVAINVNLNPRGLEFDKVLQKALDDFRLIESGEEL